LPVLVLSWCEVNMENIFFQWFSWRFLEMPREILKVWKNHLAFNLRFFSVPLLIKTFFAPWRKYEMSYGKGLDPGRFLEAIFSNLIFRTIGAVMRFFLIVFGIVSEILIFAVGLLVFLFWFVLPLFLIFLLSFGMLLIIQNV